MPALPSNIQPVEGLPQYGYDPIAEIYYDLATGEPVSWEEIRRQLDNIAEALKQQVLTISQALRDGTMALEDWQTEMMSLIKQAHIIGAVIAIGGFLLMTQLIYQQIETTVAEEYELLNNFSQQIASGQQKTDGTLGRRAALYILAMIPFYHLISRLVIGQKGFDQERSRLTPADHCTSGDGGRVGCVEEARRGWQPIGTITPIGKRNCHGNCKCRMEYRNSQTGKVTSR